MKRQETQTKMDAPSLAVQYFLNEQILNVILINFTTTFDYNSIQISVNY